MTRDTVLCAGILPIVFQGTYTFTLLLRNSHTQLWEWPKGTLEGGDGQDGSMLLQCALREFYEETGIEIRGVGPFRAPYRYVYNLGTKLQKEVYLFPLELESRHSVVLSCEHDRWCWAEVGAICGFDLGAEKTTVLDSLILDIENERRNSELGAVQRETLCSVLPKIIDSVEEDREATWFWYGSWISNEQLVHPATMSDIDLIRFGSARPNVNRIEYLHEKLTVALRETLQLPNISCGIFHQSIANPTFERGAEWSYFRSAQVPIFCGFSSIEKLVSPSVVDREPDVSNEVARLLWHRLSVLEIGDAVCTAYQFSKGVIFVNALLHSWAVDYSFTGYEDYFESLTKNAGCLPIRGSAKYATLLQALDEKRGRRRLSDRRRWIDDFCGHAEALLGSVADRLDKNCVRYCHACLQLLRGDDESAYQECIVLARDTDLFDLCRDLATSPPIGSRQRRYTTLCLLTTLRVVLWNRHVAYATPKYLSMLNRWQQQLAESGWVYGALLARSCIKHVRSTGIPESIEGGWYGDLPLESFSQIRQGLQ